MTAQGFIAIAVLGITGCVAQGATEQPAARPVRIAEVRLPETARGLRYAATLQPSEQLTLAVKATGYVAGIHTVRGVDGRLHTLQPGDVVRAGAVLVRVADAEYRERVHQAEAAVQEIEAALVKARRDFDRARTLFDGESLTRPDLDAAQAAFDGAVARRASAAAQLASARLALADTLLVSPIDGIVLERRLETGMLAGAGTVAFILGRVGDVEAVFGAPDTVIAQLSLGQRLTLTTEAFPSEPFAGRVTSIAPAADPQGRVFAVEVTLPNADGRLRSGMVGAIELDAPSTEPAAMRAAIPLSAIVRSPNDANSYSVFVVESANGIDVAHARSVSLGATVGNAVVVTEGLQVGERVIAMGSTLVTDGQPVRVIP